LLIHALEHHYADDAGVHVGGDLFIYYEEGNPQANVAPDVFVVFGSDKRLRRTYRVWNEGKAPDIVFEIVSSTTVDHDTDTKFGIYAALNVQEYVLYDPAVVANEPPLLHPALQAYRLDHGAYRRLPTRAEGSVASELLGLELRVRDGWLRLWDPTRQVWLATSAEDRAAREAAEAQARHEASAREAAEAQARHEASAREAAQAQARHEASAREAAEARAAALAAELARLRAALGRAAPDAADAGGETSPR
jgi:Uma2 family endonuclease